MCLTSVPSVLFLRSISAIAPATGERSAGGREARRLWERSRRRREDRPVKAEDTCIQLDSKKRKLQLAKMDAFECGIFIDDLVEFDIYPGD